MKNYFLIGLLFTMGTLQSCQYFSKNEGGSPQQYTCPMPEDSVFSDKPGKCPKCGMELVLMEPQQDDHAHETSKGMYTCPMPEDSVFSAKPGKCPKCGMDLVLMEPQHDDHKHESEKGMYTCPMPEDSVFSDKPGTCPKCGMDLIPVEPSVDKQENTGLDALLKPANEFVISQIPLTVVRTQEMPIEWDAIGRVEYDTRSIGTVSARVAGRIEKLYVRYRYQLVKKGQRLLDIYSPELVTAQQEWLFLAKQDPDNTAFLQSAREKLILLGMTPEQLDQVLKSGKPMMTVPVFSNYSGHVHEAAGSASRMTGGGINMGSSALLTTQELPLKEGMYLQRGQSVFTIYNPARAWALLNVYGENQQLVKTGQRVRIVPETAPSKDFRATVSFVEPFYRAGSKTLTVRVHFDNSGLKLPIGSQVKATVFGEFTTGEWLPEEAVLSLGLEKVVFARSGGGFAAKRIETGRMHNHWIEVRGGLRQTDSVAVNAQYLMDSESFIKIKDKIL